MLFTIIPRFQRKAIPCNMNIRKLAYALAVVLLSYDVLSTLIFSKLYGRFGDFNSIANF